MMLSTTRTTVGLRTRPTYNSVSLHGRHTSAGFPPTKGQFEFKLMGCSARPARLQWQQAWSDSANLQQKLFWLWSDKLKSIQHLCLDGFATATCWGLNFFVSKYFWCRWHSLRYQKIHVGSDITMRVTTGSDISFAERSIKVVTYYLLEINTK